MESDTAAAPEKKEEGVLDVYGRNVGLQLSLLPPKQALEAKKGRRWFVH